MTLMFITCKSITYIQNKLHGVKVKCLLNVGSFPPHFVGQSFRFLFFFFSFLTPPSLSLSNLNQFLATSNISESVADEHNLFFRTVAANEKFRINHSFDKN